MEESQEKKPARRVPVPVRIIVVAAVCLVAGFIGIRLFGSHVPPATYPPAFKEAAGDFTVLYYEKAPPLGFTVVEAATSYQNGVLFITVTAADGRKVVISEQPLPEEFSQSTDVVGNEKIDGADGKAALSHVEGRTTATMVSKDRRTMIIVSDTSGVGSAAVKDLMRNLKPINP